VFGKIAPLDLYMKTGIQIQRFNSLFQLVVENRQTDFSPDDRFMMVPDFLHYLLTGEMTNEVTNLSTTQCCSPGTAALDPLLLELTGLGVSNFPRLVKSGDCVGRIPKEKSAHNPRIQGLRVIAPPSHDTAAAVCAIPSAEDEPLFISSGTWTLMGVELSRPIVTEAAFRANFSNEAGHDGKICFLKNIMGLWLLQRLQREFPDALSFSDMETLARQSKEQFRSIINPQDDRFLNPSSMTREITDYCASHGQPIPDTPQRLVRCAYDSLCLSFATTLDEIIDLTGKRFSRVHLIGGGCRDDLLCQLTADMTGLEVFAGPSEASAVGNCLTQFIAQGAIGSLAEGRALLRDSIPSSIYYPRSDAGIGCLKDRFMTIAS
jgi:rhamnulokinase